MKDCRALTQSVASNDSRIDPVTLQPEMECCTVQNPVRDKSTIEDYAITEVQQYAQDQSIIEDSFIDVTETCLDASAEHYSSSDCTETNDENWMSDTDSYLELYDNLSDSDEEICDSVIGKRDDIKDKTIDDQDTGEAARQITITR